MRAHFEAGSGGTPRRARGGASTAGKHRGPGPAARFGLAAMLATAMLLATPAVSMAGDIVAAPGATAAQIQALNDCLSKISTTGQTVKGVGEVLDGLKSPKNPYKVTIAFSNVDLSEDTSPTNKANASNRTGSGSTVTWVPTDHAEYPDNPP